MAESIHPQLLPAFIAALLYEAVTPEQIDLAVARVRRLRVGDSLAGSNLLHREFAFAQAGRLEKSFNATV